MHYAQCGSPASRFAATLATLLALQFGFPADATAGPGGNRPTANLALTMSTSKRQIMPGDTFDYTLTVTNNGPNTAENVVVTDTLPSGVSLRTRRFGRIGNGLIRIDTGNLVPREKRTISLTVKARERAPRKLRNVARVRDRRTFDPNPKNNRARSLVRVIEGGATQGNALSLSPTDTLLPSAVVNAPYSVIFTGIGGQSPLEIVGFNAPPGLGFSAGADSSEVELSGIPLEPGNYWVTVTLGDSASPQATLVRNFMLSVGADLAILPRSLPLAQVGENFIATFQTANGIPPESFTSIDPLPPGLVLNGNSLTGVLNEVGEFDFSIMATDSDGNEGMRQYTLNVLPAGMVIVTDILPAGVVNASYGAQVRAIGGVPPYQWRADSALPSGLSFSSTGFFSGIPTMAGPFTVSVTARDQVGAEASADLPLTINSTGLVISAPDVMLIDILEIASIPIMLEGGTPPYQCQLVDGQLPPGLSISGCATLVDPGNNSEIAIEGTPTMAGAFEFTVLFWDSAPQPHSILLKREIVVRRKPPPD